MIKYICNRCLEDVKKTDVTVVTVSTADGNKKSYHYCKSCIKLISKTLEHAITTLEPVVKPAKEVPIAQEEEALEVPKSSVLSTNEVNRMLASMAQAETEESYGNGDQSEAVKEEVVAEVEQPTATVEVVPEKKEDEPSGFMSAVRSEYPNESSFLYRSRSVVPESSPIPLPDHWSTDPKEAGTRKVRQLRSTKYPVMNECLTSDGRSIEAMFADKSRVMFMDTIARDWSYRYLLLDPPDKLVARRDMVDLFALLVSFYRGTRVDVAIHRSAMGAQQALIAFGSYVTMLAYERWFGEQPDRYNSVGVRIDAGEVLAAVENRAKYIDIVADTQVKEPEDLFSILEYYLCIPMSAQVRDKYIFDAGGTERAL